MKMDVDANARGVLPKGTLRLSVDLSKTFPKCTEHPPDAMRGCDLPPAVLFPVSVRESASSNASLAEHPATNVHPNAPRRSSDARFLHAIRCYRPRVRVDDVDLWEYFQSADTQVDHRQDWRLALIRQGMTGAFVLGLHRPESVSVAYVNVVLGRFVRFVGILVPQTPPCVRNQAVLLGPRRLSRC